MEYLIAAFTNSLSEQAGDLISVCIILQICAIVKCDFVNKFLQARFWGKGCVGDEGTYSYRKP